MDDNVFNLHQQVKMQFKHILQVQKNLSNVSGELDDLVKLGDVVTEDDVIKAAGKIVGKGMLPANAMAGILASMPTIGGGQAMAEWVLQHDQTIKEQEMQVGQLVRQVQHQMGITALQAVDSAIRGQEGADNTLGAAPTMGNA